MPNDNGHNLYEVPDTATSIRNAQIAAGADSVVTQAMNLDLIDIQLRRVAVSEKMAASAQANAQTAADDLTFRKTQPVPPTPVNTAKAQLTDLRKFALEQAIKAKLPQVTSVLALDATATTNLATTFYNWLKTDI